MVTIDPDNGKKQIDYHYDLISGKVNKVAYQQGKGDQFFYKYLYDADNRVTESQSGRDNLIWNTDAAYRYYLHGPLVRTELGKYKVQGVDYAYTLQGWLKGINSTIRDSTRDMGGDANPSGIFSRVSRDAYGFMLNYFRAIQDDVFKNEYAPISGNNPFNPIYPYSIPPSLPQTGKSLYNGNISSSALYLSGVENSRPVGYSYSYDQLNRLREMNRHNINAVSSTWNNAVIVTAYKELIDYDPNGNILTYRRNGANTAGKPRLINKMFICIR